jgi:hypothetical protein
MKKLLFFTALISLASACTWVKVDDAGSRVAVTNQSQTSSCERLRTVNVKITSKLGPVERNSDKVSTELRNMARNEAAKYGGDTIVPASEVQNGEQSFDVYRCK